jgi:hypothetical protein
MDSGESSAGEAAERLRLFRRLERSFQISYIRNSTLSSI